jgi:hypothetical protein
MGGVKYWLTIEIGLFYVNIIILSFYLVQMRLTSLKHSSDQIMAQNLKIVKILADDHNPKEIEKEEEPKGLDVLKKKTELKEVIPDDTSRRWIVDTSDFKQMDEIQFSLNELIDSFEENLDENDTLRRLTIQDIHSKNETIRILTKE